MRGSNRRFLAALSAVLVATACTAAPRSDSAVEAAGDTTTTTVAGEAVPDGNTSTTAAPGAPATPTAPAPQLGGGGTPASPTAPGQPPVAPPPADGYRSTLFSGSSDTAGITDTTITICAHAALTYGAAFNTSADDLNVYWTALNEAGGVYGRKVQYYYENDNYSADTALQAATACKDKYNPFILLGGIGFDQIPAVRTWAENNKMLYMHHTATRKGADNLQYSFTFLPTTERTGELFGEVAVARFRKNAFGIVKRGSENWESGMQGFKAVAKAHDLDIRLEREVSVNKGSYVEDIVDLRNAGVDTVFLWLNALESTQFITQAASQNWHPQFLVFPFNLTSQTLDDQALDPPLVGVAMFQAFSKGDYSGEFARYQDDMKQFEAQYAQYRPNADLNGVGGDLLFLNWTAQKVMHQLFLQCGPDCTRNRMVELMHGYKETPISSACEIDFTRDGPGNTRRGGWALSVMEAYRSPSGKVNFRNTNTCVEHVL